jgi:hypothetical protein
MSGCEPKLPEMPNIPDANLNKPNVNSDPPAFPSFPNLPGFGTLFKYWHLNLYDILMILWILWSFWRTGKHHGDSGAVEAPSTFEDFLNYVNGMKGEYSSMSSSYSDKQINMNYENITGIGVSVIVRAPLVYPADKEKYLLSIYNNFDVNNVFTNSTVYNRRAILDLTFGKRFSDDEFNNLMNDYRRYKQTQFVTTSTFRRI